MAQRNVPIALLLSDSNSSGSNASQPVPTAAVPDPRAIQPLPPAGDYNQGRPVHNLISQFQAYVGGPSQANQPLAPLQEVYVIDDEPEQQPQPTIPAAQVAEHVKNFQALFQVTQPPSSHIPLPFSVISDRKTPPAPVKPAAPKQYSSTPSKTSINSLINSDESSLPKAQPVASPSSAPPAEKKKRANQKADGPNKKPKTESTKKATKLDAKAEPKKAGKGKKKTPEVALPVTEKPAIHATMSTDKTKGGSAQTKLAAPAFMDTKKDGTEGPESETNGSPLPLKDKDLKEKEKEVPQERPIIALDIPLLDPKNPQPGQAEVVVNVLKLAEDKYGWNVIHPNAKSAIDLMDEILDDDDDGDDDEDDDVQVVEDKPTAQKKKEELTEEQLVKRHETRMNRKVGKYDYEDPFIDDAELQWEEEITTTKEGFFVYWGPLVEDKTTAASKKGSGKSKK